MLWSEKSGDTSVCAIRTDVMSPNVSRSKGNVYPVTVVDESLVLDEVEMTWRLLS